MELVDTQTAADLLQVAPHTLENWRCTGAGPKFVKLGRRVLYPVEEIHSFISRNLRRSTSDVGDNA